MSNTLQRWGVAQGRYVESPKVDAFLQEVIEVCAKHGLSLTHEDGQGAFGVIELDEDAINWLRQAHDCTRSE